MQKTRDGVRNRQRGLVGHTHLSILGGGYGEDGIEHGPAKTNPQLAGAVGRWGCIGS